MPKTRKEQPLEEGLHICPVCDKIFLDRKTMFGHILRAHEDGQRLAYDLKADLYERWQDRIQRPAQ
jgi:uncharacterized C2H2 Zn-finger protein